MLTYWKFKQIYKYTPYWQYVWNSFKSWFHRVINIPRATYLCIRYPFLYPRNRFSGLHYTNWKIIDKIQAFQTKHRVFVSKLTGGKLETETPYYLKHFSENDFEYWKNWWSKPVYLLMKFYHDVLLQIIFGLPTYTEWDCMEPGWKKAFGKQYLKELKEAAIKDGYLKELRIMQLKEKWGRNQLYVNMYGDNVLKVIDKYEDLSWETCIKCGKPATHTSIGWISPYCAECAKTVGGYGCAERGTPEHDKLWI